MGSETAHEMSTGHCPRQPFRLFLLPLMVLVALPVQAKHWHVSQESLPGIEAGDQVRTIGQATEFLHPGDTVVIHGGVYRETVVIQQGGLPDQPIVLKAAEGEQVVVTGADVIEDWTPVAGESQVYSTPWPHRFITWNEFHTHPHDAYHRLIGRCEQVFINGFSLQQVLERNQVGRGIFYVDEDTQRLYLRPGNDEPMGRKTRVEASVRDLICVVKGDHVHLEGIRFCYAANRAQQGAVELAGNYIAIKHCVVEYTNASGAEFKGNNITVHNCIFQHNGQLGFGANRAHGLHLTGCTVRNNNTKGYNRGWEAGANKICLSRDVILEHSTFLENHGHGIWFDIGNEACTVRNCFIAHNENAGIFYEISYGLHAHDNVILGNGFAYTPGAWGAAAGISLSSSPDCLIERNLILGNKEGFNFREQLRTTPRLDGTTEPVWNHDHVIRQNVFAFNRDAQVWSWFDIADERHWPRSMQTANASSPRKRSGSSPSEHPSGLCLEDLNLRFENNLYALNPGQALFNWGVTWKRNESYPTLAVLRQALAIDEGSRVTTFLIADYFGLDFRVPAESPTVHMQCYPKGNVPNVRLGTVSE